MSFFVIILCYNLFTFLLMGYDKRQARRGGKRVRERTLLLSAVLCGGPGAFLGMELFRHKTRHLRFRVLLPVCAILQLAAVVSLSVKLY